MKLSNKVLIGFFGFLFIYLTAAFAEIRFRGNPDAIIDNRVTETATISGVTYLVLPDLNGGIRVIGSDKPRIEMRSRSGDILQKLKYNISGDTLTLTQFDPEENQRVNISIYVPQNSFTGMTVNGAGVTIGGLEQRVLSITQNAGWIRMNGHNKLGKLYIEASHSANFHILGADLDTLSVLMLNSQLTTNSPVRLLEGSMTNRSYIRASGIQEIQFKKDKSSRLNLH